MLRFLSCKGRACPHIPIKTVVWEVVVVVVVVVVFIVVLVVAGCCPSYCLLFVVAGCCLCLCLLLLLLLDIHTIHQYNTYTDASVWLHAGDRIHQSLLLCILIPKIRWAVSSARACHNPASTFCHLLSFRLWKLRNAFVAHTSDFIWFPEVEQISSFLPSGVHWTSLPFGRVELRGLLGRPREVPWGIWGVWCLGKKLLHRAKRQYDDTKKQKVNIECTRIIKLNFHSTTSKQKEAKKFGRLDFMPCQGGWWCAANFHVKIDDAEVQSLGFVQYVFFVHHAASCLCYGTVVIHGFSVPQGQASLCFVMRSISHPEPCFAQEKHLGSLWMDVCWQPVHIQLDLIWEAPSGPFTVAACPLFAFAWPCIWKCLPE